MPKHYETDKAPKMPPKVDNSYKKKDVFETTEIKKKNKTLKKNTRKKI